MFHVGQKVVCVDDRYRVAIQKKSWFGLRVKTEWLYHNLNAGDVYTVTNTTMIRCAESGQEVICLFLDSACHLFGYRWVPLPSFQFRPVQERKTNISIFTTMLAPTKVRVDA